MSQSLSVKSGAAQVVKSVILTLTFLFFGVTVLALTVNAANLKTAVLHPALQVIKPLAVLLGAMLSLREGKGILKGILSGAISYALLIPILSALSGGGSVLPSALLDFLAFSLYGALSGILAVNLK